MTFNKRLAFILVVTFGNLASSLLASTVLAHIGTEITIFLVCSILSSALSTSQYERALQKGELNSLQFDIITTAICLFAFVILHLATGRPATVTSITLLAAYVLLSCNAHIICCSASANGTTTKAYGANGARLVILAVLAASLYLTESVTYQAFLFYNCVATALLLVFYLVVFRPTKTLNTPPLQLAGVYFTSIDFAKGQAWILVFPAFVSSTSLSIVFLYRQLLGPLAIFLATKRAQLFDRAISNNSELGKLHISQHRTYLKLIILSVVILVSMVVSQAIDIPQAIIAGGWLAILLTQDLRAYWSRTSPINAAQALCLLIVSSAPLIAVWQYSLNVHALNISMLIFAAWVGELFWLLFLRFKV